MSRSDHPINTPKHNSELTDRARELRKSMTREEKHLWYDFLRIYPIRFLRQKVIDNFIVDFYCNKARLIIELDGSQHYEESAILYDNIRTVHLNQRDLTVVRIPNPEINRNFRGVCEYINALVISKVGYDPWEAKSPPCLKGEVTDR